MQIFREKIWYLFVDWYSILLCIESMFELHWILNFLGHTKVLGLLHITHTGAAYPWKPMQWISQCAVFCADVNAREGLELCSCWVSSPICTSHDLKLCLWVAVVAKCVHFATISLTPDGGISSREVLICCSGGVLLLHHAQIQCAL